MASSKKSVSSPKRRIQPSSTVHSHSAHHNVGFWQAAWGRFIVWSVKHHFWKRLALGLVAFVLLATSSMYGVAQWYLHKHQDQPTVLGATFIPGYARYYDLDPKETLSAMINDLGVKQLRLVSYWEDIEKDQNIYNFDELDWQFKAAEASGVKISLAVGLRQPRWPECHMPTWAERMQGKDWYQPLNTFMTRVVERYKDSPALESYQLENEYFLKAFGLCSNFDRQRLADEFTMVKHLDPNHPVVVSMSNNAIGTPINDPTPDMWAISVYKRVWDKTITKRYFEYPLPAWYYAFRAGFTEITRGHDSFIHELQTEAWAPGSLKDATIQEQNKSLDATRLHDRIEYGRATGMKTIGLWGVEWWYWRKTKMNDSSLWDAAKEEITKTNVKNQQLKDN